MPNFLDREQFLSDIFRVFGKGWFSAADLIDAMTDGSITKTDRWTLNDQLGIDQHRSLSRHLAQNPDFIRYPKAVRQDGRKMSMFRLDPAAILLVSTGKYQEVAPERVTSPPFNGGMLNPGPPAHNYGPPAVSLEDITLDDLLDAAKPSPVPTKPADLTFDQLMNLGETR